jgi:DNA primase
MIIQKSVQEILDVVRIEDIVSDFVTLKRKGANLGGLCPFHNEKTPSFSVSPTRNIFKCFGCGEGGDSVGFLMKHENISYPEALKYIAKKYNIRVEETEVSQEFIAEKQFADSLYIVNERALTFFDNQLFETDKGKSIGLNYFKSRGFREETIKKWGLGFTSDAQDGLTKLLISEGYKNDVLNKLGLTTSYNRDFFRGRVMFTIHGLTGKPIAFAGRIMAKDVNAPKYINSPETEIYTKSRVLYGMFHARKAIQKADECILCEGYTDVISLHQSGIENVVASSGTSLTVEQIRQIKRFTPNIKIIYDGDAAGVKAALRGLDLVLEEDMNVRVVLLPDKEDPDSYMQRVGATAFQEFIDKQAKDFILFRIDLAEEETRLEPIKRAKLLTEIIQMITVIPNEYRDDEYAKYLSVKFGMNERVVKGDIEKGRTKRREKQGQRYGTAAPAPSISDDVAQPTDNHRVIEEKFGAIKAPIISGNADFQERDIARILIASGGEIYNAEQGISVAAFVLSNIEDILADFDNRVYLKVAQEAAALVQKNIPLSIQHFLTHESKEIRDLAATVLSNEHSYSDNWESKFNRPLETQKAPDLNFNRDSEQALKRFRLKKIMRLCETNQEMVRKTSDSGDISAMMTHLKIQKKLIEMRNLLAVELNTVIFK